MSLLGSIKKIGKKALRAAAKVGGSSILSSIPGIGGIAGTAGAVAASVLSSSTAKKAAKAAARALPVLPGVGSVAAGAAGVGAGMIIDQFTGAPTMHKRRRRKGITAKDLSSFKRVARLVDRYSKPVHKMRNYKPKKEF